MGQIANRTLSELLFRLKHKLAGKKDAKKPQKTETLKGGK